VAAVRESGGQAWWVADESITVAGEVLRERAYQVAPECWAALAGVRVAASETAIEQACLVLTGRSFSLVVGGSEEHGRGSLKEPVEAFDEVLALVEGLR
jgi:hypothetical protein